MRSMIWLFVLIVTIMLFSSGCEATGKGLKKTGQGLAETGKGMFQDLSKTPNVIDKADKWFQENMW